MPIEEGLESHSPIHAVISQAVFLPRRMAVGVGNGFRRLGGSNVGRFRQGCEEVQHNP